MRRRHSQRGAAAVEFVLVMPVLLVLMAGAMTLGLASYAKFRMADAAMVASRRCAIAGPASCAGTASTLFTNRWPDANKVCSGGPQITTTIDGSIATVQARCSFTGGVMQGYLGLSNFPIVASAATPY